MKKIIIIGVGVGFIIGLFVGISIQGNYSYAAVDRGSRSGFDKKQWSGDGIITAKALAELLIEKNIIKAKDLQDKKDKVKKEKPK